MCVASKIRGVKMEDMPLKLKFYTGLLFFIGAAILFYSLEELLARFSFGIVVFILLAIISEELAVKLPKGEATVSVGFAIILASIIIYGPEIGAWIASIGTINRTQLKSSVYVIAFNRGQFAISAYLAGHFYISIGGIPGSLIFPADLVFIFAASLVYFCINIITVSLVISLDTGENLLNIWVGNLKGIIPNYITLSPLGILIVFAYLEIGYLGLLLLFIPLLVARHTFCLYIKMREVYLSTIKTLSQTLDAKDSYTGGHSLRVGELVKEIGEEMGIKGERLEGLEYVAILHDIGKISIPETVLNKPGKLTEEEYNQIKEHPQIGQRIIEDVEFLSDFSHVIRHHHERYDGQGYPDGLNGDEVSLESKIVALADAFDAMTSERSYQRTLDIKEAIEEINRGSGKQFDPQVVEAFKKVLKNRGIY